MQKIRPLCLPGLAALIFAAGFPVHAATFTWDGGASGASWGAGVNWDPDGVPTFDNTADIIFNSAGAASLSNFTGTGRTIRSLSFNANADSDITIRTTTTAAGTTAANLTFEADAGNASVTVDAGAAAALITVGTGGGNLVLNSTLEIVHNGSGELLLGRPVSGDGGIIKTGAGVMRFNQQANSFTGNIVINGGTLIDGGATAGSALGTGPKTITLGGGTLLFERNYGANSVMGDKSFITTAATSSIIRYNDLAGATRNFTITGAAESATLNGDLLVDNISTSGGADVLVWNLTTTGGGLFSYSGAQDDVLNNTNDLRFQVNGDLSGHNGGIEVRKGTWLANGASALGGGTINLGVTASADSAAVSLNASSATTIINALNVRSGAGTRLIDNTNASGVARSWDGVLTLDGTLTYRSNFDDDFTSSSTLTGSGGLVKLGTGQLDLRGSNGGYSGNITVSEGELRVVQASMGSGAVSIASGANLSLQRTSGSILYSNDISGAGTMTVGGGNLIALSGANTSSGDITVNGSGTTLRIDNASFNNSTANISLNNANSTLRLNANAADQTIANAVSGTGSVVKQGNFLTTLTGANSYSGSTTVNSGSLQVGSAGVGQTGSGVFTVTTAATILGSGVVQGESFTAESGSTVHAGDGTAQTDYGTLTFTPVSGAGTFDFQSGSTIVLGINPGGASDKLNFIGNGSNTLLFNGSLSVGPSSLIPTAAEVFDLIDWSGLTAAPTFASHFTGTTLFGNGDESAGLDLPDIFGTGYIWDISSFTTNGTIAIVLVPEPSRMLLLFLGVLAGAARRRRVLR